MEAGACGRGGGFETPVVADDVADVAFCFADGCIACFGGGHFLGGIEGREGGPERGMCGGGFFFRGCEVVLKCYVGRGGAPEINFFTLG